MKNYYAIFCLFLALMITTGATAQDVIWEEDFDGSANGWTSNSISPADTFDWYWEPTGFVGDGAITNQFIDPNLSIDSPTSSNGAMVYNADFFTTQGDPDNIPPGDPSTYPKYIGELISPTIDLSGVTNAVSLEWTQLFTILNVSPGAAFRSSLQWSTDDGATWSDPIDANEDKDINTTYNGDVQTFPIPGVEGESLVRFKFTFGSDFYHWVIDDIKIIEREANNMRANTNFYAIAPNVVTPASQVEEFGFLCDIENIGGQPQTNVELSITITDEGGNQAYFDVEEYGTIAVDSLAENVSFGGFTPDAVEQVYAAVYEVSSDSTDFDPSDNTIEWSFQVGDTTYQKELGADRAIYPAEANWNVGDPRSWAYGNHFYIVNGEGYYANSATFAIDVSDAGDPDPTGQSVRVGLYSWDDDNADENADPEERDLVALNNYTIEGNEEFDELITVPLTDLISGQTVELEDDTDYILIMEFITEDETRVDFGAADQLDYSAMILNSVQLGAPRYASMLGIAGDIQSEPWSSVGFGADFQVITRLNIGAEPLFTNTQEQLDPVNEISLFPNPADDLVTLELELEQNSSRVFIDLLDISGRMLQRNEVKDVTRFTQDINTAQLPTGTYFVRITTDFGARTERLIVK